MRSRVVAVALAVSACSQGGDAPSDADTFTLDDSDPVVLPGDDSDPAETDGAPPDPEPLAITLTPAHPLAGEALTCAADTTAQVTWTWLREGAPSGVLTATLPADTTLPYETWTCRGRTVDGLYAGEASVQVDEACQAFVGDGAEAFIVSDGLLQAQGDTPFTVELWFRRDRSGVAEDLINHVGGPLGGGAMDFALRLTDDDRLAFHSGASGDDDCTALSVPAPSSGAWHHVAADWDPSSSRKRLYVDGVLVASCGTRERPEKVNGLLVLGARFGVPPSHHFQGAIDEVRVSGVQRYTTQFVPAAWHEPDADTLVLLHLNEVAGAPGALTTPDAANPSSPFKLAGLQASVSGDHSACDTRAP